MILLHIKRRAKGEYSPAAKQSMGFVDKLTRRKRINQSELSSQSGGLKRCLTTIDLTALGVGSTLGAGAYVLTGQVAKTQSGPAVVLSFLIAGLASVMAGMCYAEFAARVPLAGSAYTYTYVTIGEMCAFVIGWNLILEYVIGNASVARTFTGYLNHLTGDHIIPYLSTHLRMNISSLAPYLDVFAFAIVMTMTMLLVVGVKESATLTKMFTMLNLLVLSFVAVCGLFTEQWSNWSIDATQVPNASKCAQIGDVLEQHKQCCARPDGCGEGGFTPYGFSGVVAGAATCFFAFVGFDVIATTGEEARNPSKTIPLAILVSLGICCFFYMATSTTLTLMTPYFEIDSDAPFVVVFDKIGWTVSAFLVSIGAVCALSTSLLGSMFSMPRVVLAMARDGLLFECFAYISPSLKTPVVATLCSGLFAGTMAALFDVGSLVEMMSIGTLMAYTVVAASVLMLRYQTHVRTISVLEAPKEVLSSSIGSLTMLVGALLTILAAVITWFGIEDVLTMVVVLILSISIVILLVVIDRRPKSEEQLAFTVPFVPYFPALSMFINISLMLRLRSATWMRFLVWMAIGFVVYFFYGISHSGEESNLKFEPISAKSLLQTSSDSDDSDDD